MTNPITSIVLIVLSLGLFFTVTQKQYAQVKAVRETNEKYEAAIHDNEELLKKRDNLLNEFNAFSPEDKEKLNKLLPDNMDTVRLVIDINGVLTKYSVKMKNILLDSAKGPGQTGSTAQQAPTTPDDPNAPYKSTVVSFGVTANYDTLISILNDLEATLRLTDITSVTFTSSDKNDIYDYTITLKTYWMK